MHLFMFLKSKNKNIEINLNTFLNIIKISLLDFFTTLFL